MCRCPNCMLQHRTHPASNMQQIHMDNLEYQHSALQQQCMGNVEQLPCASNMQQIHLHNHLEYQNRAMQQQCMGNFEEVFYGNNQQMYVEHPQQTEYTRNSDYSHNKILLQMHSHGGFPERCPSHNGDYAFVGLQPLTKDCAHSSQFENQNRMTCIGSDVRWYGFPEFGSNQDLKTTCDVRLNPNDRILRPGRHAEHIPCCQLIGRKQHTSNIDRGLQDPRLRAMNVQNWTPQNSCFISESAIPNLTPLHVNPTFQNLPNQSILPSSFCRNRGMLPSSLFPNQSILLAPFSQNQHILIPTSSYSLPHCVCVHSFQHEITNASFPSLGFVTTQDNMIQGNTSHLFAPCCTGAVRQETNLSAMDPQNCKPVEHFKTEFNKRTALSISGIDGGFCPASSCLLIDKPNQQQMAHCCPQQLVTPCPVEHSRGIYQKHSNNSSHRHACRQTAVRESDVDKRILANEQEANVPASSSTHRFEDLPSLVILKILSFLTIQDIAVCVRPTCKLLHEISQDPQLWRHVHISEVERYRTRHVLSGLLKQECYTAGRMHLETFDQERNDCKDRGNDNVVRGDDNVVLSAKTLSGSFSSSVKPSERRRSAKDAHRQDTVEVVYCGSSSADHKEANDEKETLEKSLIDVSDHLNDNVATMTDVGEGKKDTGGIEKKKHQVKTVRDHIRSLTVNNEPMIDRCVLSCDTKADRPVASLWVDCMDYLPEGTVCPKLERLVIKTPQYQTSVFAMLPRHTWLQHLSITITNKSRPVVEEELIQSYTAFLALKSLRTFKFVFPTSSTAFGHHPQLLNAVPYYTAAEAFFRDCGKSLEKVEVAYVSAVVIRALLDAARSLQDLAFQTHILATDAFDVSKLTRPPPRLKSLTINSTMGNIDAELVKGISAAFPTLKTINFADSVVFNEALKILLAKCVHLEEIHLNKLMSHKSPIKLSADTLSGVCSPHRLARLREFSCTTEVDDGFVRKLCEHNGASLTHLTLSLCPARATDASLYQLAASCPKLRQLRLLNVPHNGAARGVLHLLQTLPCLKSLEVKCSVSIGRFVYPAPRASNNNAKKATLPSSSSSYINGAPPMNGFTVNRRRTSISASLTRAQWLGSINNRNANSSEGSSPAVDVQQRPTSTSSEEPAARFCMERQSSERSHLVRFALPQNNNELGLQQKNDLLVRQSQKNVPLNTQAKTQPKLNPPPQNQRHQPSETKHPGFQSRVDSAERPAEGSRLDELVLSKVPQMDARDMELLTTACPRLTKLALHGCVRLKDDAVKVILTNCPHLQSLTIEMQELYCTDSNNNHNDVGLPRRGRQRQRQVNQDFGPTDASLDHILKEGGCLRHLALLNCYSLSSSALATVLVYATSLRDVALTSGLGHALDDVKYLMRKARGIARHSLMHKRMLLIYQNNQTVFQNNRNRRNRAGISQCRIVRLKSGMDMLS